MVAVAGPESVDRHAGVLLDNEAGAALAIGHLLDLGHRDIAFINGPRHVPWCSDRWGVRPTGSSSGALTRRS